MRAITTAEPKDTSDYFIIKEQYANLPTAVIENEGLTEQDIEAIREVLIPRVMKMVGEWNIQPKNTFIEFA